LLVTYFGSQFGSPTIVFDAVSTDKTDPVPSKAQKRDLQSAFVAYPRIGRHISFPGLLLAGTCSDLLQHPEPVLTDRVEPVGGKVPEPTLRLSPDSLGSSKPSTQVPTEKIESGKQVERLRSTGHETIQDFLVNSTSGSSITGTNYSFRSNVTDGNVTSGSAVLPLSRANETDHKVRSVQNLDRSTSREAPNVTSPDADILLPRKISERRRRLTGDAISTTHHLRGSVQSQNSQLHTVPRSAGTRLHPPRSAHVRNENLFLGGSSQYTDSAGKILEVLFTPKMHLQHDDMTSHLRVEIAVDLWKGKAGFNDKHSGSKGKLLKESIDVHKFDMKMTIKAALEFMHRRRNPVFVGQFCEGRGAEDASSSVLCSETVARVSVADDNIRSASSRQGLEMNGPRDTAGNSVRQIRRVRHNVNNETLRSQKNDDIILSGSAADDDFTYIDDLIHDDVVLTKFKELLASRRSVISEPGVVGTEDRVVADPVQLITVQAADEHTLASASFLQPVHGHIEGWMIPLPQTVIHYLALQTQQQLVNRKHAEVSSHVYTRLLKLTGKYHLGTPNATVDTSTTPVATTIQPSSYYHRLTNLLTDIKDINRFDMVPYFHFTQQLFQDLQRQGLQRHAEGSAGVSPGNLTTWSSSNSYVSGIKSKMGSLLTYLIGRSYDAHDFEDLDVHSGGRGDELLSPTSVDAKYNVSEVSRSSQALLKILPEILLSATMNVSDAVEMLRVLNVSDAASDAIFIQLLMKT
jgi:hypothetical protein